MVENTWLMLLGEQADIGSGEYNLNSVSLYAMIEVLQAPEAALASLQEVVDRIREVTQTIWEEYTADQGIEDEPTLWGPQFELRTINDEQELKSLRDFIVQKMLGGEELSDLGVEDTGEIGDDFNLE